MYQRQLASARHHRILLLLLALTLPPACSPTQPEPAAPTADPGPLRAEKTQIWLETPAHGAVFAPGAVIECSGAFQVGPQHLPLARPKLHLLKVLGELGIGSTSLKTEFFQQADQRPDRTIPITVAFTCPETPGRYNLQASLYLADLTRPQAVPPLHHTTSSRIVTIEIQPHP